MAPACEWLLMETYETYIQKCCANAHWHCLCACCGSDFCWGGAPPVRSTTAAMQQYIVKTVVLTLCSSASKAIYITAVFYGQPTAQAPCGCTRTHRALTMTLIIFSQVSLITEDDYFFSTLTSSVTLNLFSKATNFCLKLGCCNRKNIYIYIYIFVHSNQRKKESPGKEITVMIKFAWQLGSGLSLLPVTLPLDYSFIAALHKDH